MHSAHARLLGCLLTASLACNAQVVVGYEPDASTDAPVVPRADGAAPFVGTPCGALSIRQLQSAAPSGATCAIPRTPAAEPVTRGILDVALRDEYLVRPLFEWTGTSPVQVTTLAIELREGTPDGPLIGDRFSISLSAQIPGATAAGSGFESAELAAIPRQIGSALRNAVCQIDASSPATAECPAVRSSSVPRTVLLGLTASGRSDSACVVLAAPVRLIIEVCCGCLLRFPAESDAPARPGPDCSAGGAPGGPASCTPGQDFPTDCRLCAGTNPAFCHPRGYSATGGTCPL
jgi:hypothetical protein